MIFVLKNYKTFVESEKIRKDLNLIKNIELSTIDLEFVLTRLKEFGLITTTDFISSPIRG